jgi:hypothetical protein
LKSTFERLVSVGVQGAVRDYRYDGDAVGLVSSLDKCDDLAKLALELAGTSKIIEKHIHQALTALILAARADRALFQICSELGDNKEGEKKKWLDLAFVLRGQNTAYAIELECCDELKKKIEFAVQGFARKS